MTLTREPEAEHPLPLNIPLEGVATRVRDAHDHLRVEGGSSQYEPPWGQDPWRSRTPLGEAEAALEWVLDLIDEARTR